MDIHIVMTMPTGARKCLGATPKDALDAASRTFVYVDTITLDKYRVDTPAQNKAHGTEYWCPLEDCEGSRNGSAVSARKALDAAIEANILSVGNPNLSDPEEVLYHLDGCMNMACSGCAVPYGMREAVSA